MTSGEATYPLFTLKNNPSISAKKEMQEKRGVGKYVS